MNNKNQFRRGALCFVVIIAMMFSMMPGVFADADNLKIRNEKMFDGAFAPAENESAAKAQTAVSDAGVDEATVDETTVRSATVSEETTAPAIASAGKCRMTLPKDDILIGKRFTANASGDRMSAEGRNPGDTKYVPAKWRMKGPSHDKSGAFSPDGAAAFSLPKAGNYTMDIIFAHYEWVVPAPVTGGAAGPAEATGGAWRADPSGNIQKSTTVTVKAVIKLNPSGGKVSRASFNMSYGAKWTKLPVAAKRKHAFKGWYTGKTVGSEISAGGQFLGRTNQTLFARWKVGRLQLDAREMILAKIGAQLSLKAVVTPSDADRSGIRWSSSNKKVATVNRDGKVTAKGWGRCVIRIAADGKEDRCTVTVANKWVAITFDDGPGKPTAALLDGLQKRNVRATFFLVGANVGGNRNLVKRMKTDGHEIANHTWNHPYGSAEVKSQLARTDDAIRKAAGVTTKLMRPPGGVINSATRNCGKPIILWTADPKDWRDRNASLVYERVVSQTKSGGIILLHDLYSSSTSAGLRAIDTLKKKGYAFVTVSEILGNPRAGVVYTHGSATPRTMKIT